LSCLFIKTCSFFLQVITHEKTFRKPLNKNCEQNFLREKPNRHFYTQSVQKKLNQTQAATCLTNFDLITWQAFGQKLLASLAVYFTMSKITISLYNVGIVLLISVFSNALFAQSLDFGVFAGKSSYLGEMQSEYYNPDESKLAYGGYFRTRFGKHFALRAQYLQTTLSGNDNNAIDLDQWNRNLNFSTNLSELGLLAELTIVSFGRDRRRVRARSYFFGGIAGIYFNPQTLHNGKWVDLQPLGTEGQFLNEDMQPYKKYDYVIPFGWGFEFHATRALSFGVEVKLRKTNTDYLDDISGQYPDIQALRAHNPTAADLSFRTPEVIDDYQHNPVGEQRGDDKKFDKYLFVGFTAAVKFFEKKSTKPAEIPIYFVDPIKH